MELDVMGILGACSYALDCVEAELVQITHKHAKRVAYMSVCVAQEMGIQGETLRDLAGCALLHDNALTQYIQEELHSNLAAVDFMGKGSSLGVHCILGEKNMRDVPLGAGIKDVVLYHHENADGSGAFGKTWKEVPLFSRIIHLCDLLDGFCRTEVFDEQTWGRACSFLESVRDKVSDSECIDAFLRAFPEEHFLTLGDANLEKRLWSRVPRAKQELSFAQIQGLANFFARIVDYKSPFTSTHSLGVARGAEKMARYMGFDEITAEKMYLAGALHDIGKVAIGNEILEKPARLTEEEYNVMKHHAAYTYYILSDVQDFEDMRDWAAFHHERLDGTGYPFRKTAAELNVQERIMACMDIYQALTESRPYKAGMPHEKACDILKDMADKGWVDAQITENIRKCFAN